jgi:hypothetical protein
MIITRAIIKTILVVLLLINNNLFILIKTIKRGFKEYLAD